MKFQKRCLLVLLALVAMTVIGCHRGAKGGHPHHGHGKHSCEKSSCEACCKKHKCHKGHSEACKAAKSKECPHKKDGKSCPYSKKDGEKKES